eukprot:CAMPEP_0181180610 /NCGR_PEP_ID=MMETSP1096-20121128/6892_1 /TAXON_ID=156174 ORGANISM="Chrysochromulina ericina, Strain CCMP281" /NCGR_SAMPLE_ID=MMETSP1096 /ASSEMBLY_ACC=CAM_ASM_000453 /LENGTH=103 /DNA_ID=CAMNT_0023269051 /DNA_START=561 /DNA_END=869 /DNA_ORIENTATION=-
MYQVQHIPISGQGSDKTREPLLEAGGDLRIVLEHQRRLSAALLTYTLPHAQVREGATHLASRHRPPPMADRHIFQLARRQRAGSLHRSLLKGGHEALVAGIEW